ncbi:hypothetical protein AB1L88_11690 [Tautonia sp. JC769]|uniref:hypothetical protein n=1 Tax=Tautonia sp. JC769 TaxID=3232135 RepID=UPI0034581752
MRRFRLMLWPVAFLALALAVGFDVHRPLSTARERQLEMELEATQDERDAAIEEAEALAVEVEELTATLEVEQAHREQAERKLADCEKGATR